MSAFMLDHDDHFSGFSIFEDVLRLLSQRIVDLLLYFSLQSTGWYRYDYAVFFKMRRKRRKRRKLFSFFIRHSGTPI